MDEQYRIASALLDGAPNRLWLGIKGFRNREISIGCFEIILGNAPYSDYAPLVLMNIARGHQYLGNIDEAIDALDRLVNNYPQSVVAPDASLAWQSCTRRLSRALHTTRPRQSRPSPTTRIS